MVWTQPKKTPRDVGFLKPKGYEKHLTITEVSQRVDRDISWLRRLERNNKIPKAHRVKHGSLSVRLWSPTQVKEIEKVLKNAKPGRPRK